MLNNNEILIKNKLRENIIAYIYSYELFNEKINSKNAFEIWEYNNKEVEIIDKIINSYEIFKKIIISFCKQSWTWERISPLNRAVLIFGSFEMTFTDKNLIIDTLIKYSKEYCPDESYKFINSILDKIGKYYEKMKNNKK